MIGVISTQTNKIDIPHPDGRKATAFIENAVGVDFWGTFALGLRRLRGSRTEIIDGMEITLGPCEEVARVSMRPGVEAY